MRTFAVIVTFEPDVVRLRENLSAIGPQVSRVTIFDNGSSNAGEVASMVAEVESADLIRGSTNLGIARALNDLCNFALGQGATHVLTLDQDSVSESNMVEELTRVAVSTSAPLVTPYIVDRNKMTVAQYLDLDLPDLEFYQRAARRGAITSGALMDLEVWQAVGGFDEALFIDYVDYDLNQRLLLAGHRIARANRAHLLHEVGRANSTWLWVPRRDLAGRWRIERFYSFGHSPQRCYYKARNRVIFTKKYGRAIGVTNEGVWQIPQQVGLTMLFERDRRKKLGAFLRGTWDGMRTPVGTR